MSLIETQNTLRTLRETCQYLQLNGIMRTLQGMVRDSEWYKVIVTASMAIECWSISNKMTYAGELAISQVAPMHRLLHIRLLLVLMTTQGKTLWIPQAKHG